jgi:glycosyltransferase involved in cell wall biosynthesis
MTRPLVSIITPTLNQGRYIEDTLRSVRSQTYEAIEHIVVDGGSTDETLDILAQHPSAAQFRWTSGPDGGMYDAVNKGLVLAAGEILAYLNSDDLYFPWTVATVVDLMEKTGAAVVYGDAVKLDGGSDARMPWLQPSLHLPSIRAAGSLIQPAVFWRRAVYEQIGPFDSTLKFVGDLDYWLRAASRFPFVQVDEMLAIDRAHADQFSQRMRKELSEEERRTRRRHSASSQYGLPPLLARSRSALQRRIRWLQFVRAVRQTDRLPAAQPAMASSWRQTIESTRPTVTAGHAVGTLVPGIGRRHLASVRWGVDPLLVARGER